MALTLGGSSLMGMVKSTSDPSEQIENAHLGHLAGGVVLGVLPEKICLLDSSHTCPMLNQTSATCGVGQL